MLELARDHYALAIPKLREVSSNHLFARSVVEKHVDGKVYVDDINDPKLRRPLSCITS